MARPKSLIDNDYLLSLKKLVELNYGTSVFNTSDCVKINSLIEKGGYGTVSVQTLRRLFGLIKTEFNPSLYTLNVLCKYCGYDDWARFCETYNPANISLQDIINLCIAFFNVDLPPIDTHELNHPYYHAALNIAKLINKNINLYSKIIPKLIKSKAASNYFFERFVLIDKLCTDYANGFKYYLKINKQPEPVIFGNAMLFLGAFLNEDLALSGKYLLAINKEKDWFTTKVHPYVVARAAGSNILYYHATDNHTKKAEWLNKLDELLVKNFNQFGFHKDSCEFEFMICEYLLLSECYERVIVLMQTIFKTFANATLNENKAKWHYLPSHIIYFKALVMQGDYKRAGKLPFTDGKLQDPPLFWYASREVGV